MSLILLFNQSGAAELGLADSGASAEQLDLQGLLALAEAGLGAEVLDVATSLDIGDAAAGVETLALASSIALVDAALGSEAMVASSDLPAPPTFAGGSARQQPPQYRTGQSRASDRARGADVVQIAVFAGVRDTARASAALAIVKIDPELEQVLLALAA